MCLENQIFQMDRQSSHVAELSQPWPIVVDLLGFSSTTEVHYKVLDNFNVPENLCIYAIVVQCTGLVYPGGNEKT